jgi:hypothetical protein
MDISAQIPTTMTDPGPSGAGDAGLVRVNLNTAAVPIFDPHQARTFLGVTYSPYAPGPNGATGNFWFDPTVFNTTYSTAAFTYGTYPRNYLRGPHRTNLDFAVAKKTSLVGERLNLEFRAEFFNIFNNAQFEMPTLNIADPSFGQITSTYFARVIQLAARLNF